MGIGVWLQSEIEIQQIKEKEAVYLAMGKRSRGRGTWDDLPAHVVARIVLKLPVKDVIRSTSLNKSIYSIVHSKFFIDAYNRHSLLCTINPPLFVHLSRDPVKDQMLLYLEKYYNDGCMRVSFPCARLHISNFCNSLFCLYQGFARQPTKPFMLWNPSIHKTLALPPPNNLGGARFLGLGFVKETSDYKVLMVRNGGYGELYSLQRNSWKDIGHLGPGICSSDLSFPVYVKGSLYWPSRVSGRMVAVVFDFKDEALSYISLPDEWAYFSRVVLRFHSGSSVAAVICSSVNVFNVLVMDVTEKKWRLNGHSFQGPPDSLVSNLACFDKGGGRIFCWPDDDQNILKSTPLSASYVSNLALLDIA